MRRTKVAPGAVLVFDEAAMAAIVSKIENAAVAATVERLGIYMHFITAEARNLWYKQVNARTGKSGEIVGGVTEVTGDRIKAAIGSKDTRTKKGKPAIFYIHRPGPLSFSRRYLREAEKDALRAQGKPVPKYIYYPNPKRSDGKFLVAELINKPANVGKRALRAAIKDEIRKMYRRS